MVLHVSAKSRPLHSAPCVHVYAQRFVAAKISLRVHLLPIDLTIF